MTTRVSTYATGKLSESERAAIVASAAFAALLAAKLEAITPRLQIAAARFAGLDQEADDLYQEAVTAIVERANSAPTFLEQKDAYICQFGVWSFRHVISRSAHSTEREDEDSATVTIEDYLSEYHLPTPEDAVIRREEAASLEAATASLEEKNQKVVTLLMQGYSQTEIADYLDIDRSAISQRKKTIQKAFKRLLE